jgi:ATP-dependent helicase/nuclease subunit A
VGDVKQSIYRFRLAEPALFLRKYHQYGKGEGGARIDLNRNYRSNKGIITAVNFLFRQLMSMSSSELDYDATAELKAGQEDFGAKTELWLVDRADVGADLWQNVGADLRVCPKGQNVGADLCVCPKAPEEPSLVLEARLLGRRILELQEEGYNLSDMAVLLRAAKNRESLLVQEFADMGIAAVAGSRPDYLQTAEISLMLALLAIIDNPLQELELATVLRSPLYSFSLDELAQIRWCAPQEQLYAALAATAQGQGGLAGKCRLFLEQLTGWRESLRRRRISELIGAIYTETGLLQLAGALPRGAARQENLLVLKERAREYEASSYRGLFRFLLFLADGRGKSTADSTEPAEGKNALRVMSIHRSKGLEFPVVIVANLGGAFALLDEKQDVVWHKEFGLGPKVVEREQRRIFSSLAQEAVARRLHKEALAEEMRVLYVALTRARERLILSGVVKNLGHTADAWRRQVAGQGSVLAGELLLDDKRPLDWLGQALLRHPQAGPLREAAGIVPNSAEERQLLIPDISGWQISIVPEDKLQAPQLQAPQLQAPQQTAAGEAESLGLQKNPKNHRLLPVSQLEEPDYVGAACSRPQIEQPFSAAADSQPASAVMESPQKQGVAAALSYKYPYRAACEAAAKWTVTELNQLEDRRQKTEDRIKPPTSTLQPPSSNLQPPISKLQPPISNLYPPASSLSPLIRGSAQHKLLEYLDFSAAATAEAVLLQLAFLMEKGVLTAEEAALVEAEKIAGFAGSPLGRRMAAAARTLREAPFTYALPALELVPGAAPADKLVLQGVIDAAFWEGGGWVLLDYKTGGAGQTEQQLKEAYATQLHYYSRALQDIWQEPVKEAWLCFVDLQKNIRIESR